MPKVVILVSLGNYAGQQAQGDYSVAIGSTTGRNDQKSHSIAIGRKSDYNGCNTNTIIINAETDTVLDSVAASSTYIKPIREVTTSNTLCYNEQTGEVSYSSIGARSYGWMGLVTDAVNKAVLGYNYCLFNTTNSGSFLESVLTNNIITAGWNDGNTLPMTSTGKRVGGYLSISESDTYKVLFNGCLKDSSSNHIANCVFVLIDNFGTGPNVTQPAFTPIWTAPITWYDSQRRNASFEYCGVLAPGDYTVIENSSDVDNLDQWMQGSSLSIERIG